MLNRYVLVLVSLNPDGSDLSHNIYPNFGNFEDKKYKPNKDIRFGLYGTLFGFADRGKWVNTDPVAAWRVVRVENNEDLISLDNYENLVKFKKCVVVHDGNLISCSQYMCDNCADKGKCDPAVCKLLALKERLGGVQSPA